MNLKDFEMETAVSEIPDIRHIVAVMFGTTDLITIKKILNKAGYPIGSGTSFAEQLRKVNEKWIDVRNSHKEWLPVEKGIDKVTLDYGGLCDPFDKLEKHLAAKARC